MVNVIEQNLIWNSHISLIPLYPNQNTHIMFKEIYRVKLHVRDKSHDVVIVQENKVNGIKIKFTYECYNSIERFTGETFVGGKWETCFYIMDLGVLPETSNYIRDESYRLNRCETLIDKGITFIEMLHK
jgi:hypothetical protein